MIIHFNYKDGEKTVDFATQSEAVNSAKSSKGGEFDSQMQNTNFEKTQSSYFNTTGTPETIRTSDPQIRSLILYPAELQAHIKLVVPNNQIRSLPLCLSEL